MKESITSGALRSGQVFRAEKLTMNDLPLIMKLQAKVENALVTKSTLSPLSDKEFTNILDGNGFMVGIFIDEKLIAFRAMLQPEIDTEHLGIDANLPETDLPKVIYSEVSNVDPDYRGNGLQKYMGKLVMNEIDHKNSRYVCATVSPMNIPSLKDKFNLGLEIVALKGKYQGMLRYIFIKDLSANVHDKSFNEIQWIPVEKIEEQRSLIQSGFRGTGMIKQDRIWHVKYCR